MSQFAINLIWDPSVLSQPNAAQIEATLTSEAQVFASNFSNPITLNLHVGWGEVEGQTFEADSIGESAPNLITSTAGAVKGAIGGLPYLGNPNSPIDLTDVEAAAVGLSASAAVDAYIGFSSQPGEFIFTSADYAQGSYFLANVFDHEVSEVMGRVSNVGTQGPVTDTVLDLFRYTAPGVTTTSASASAYFSRDGGYTNEAWFNTDPTGDSGDWSYAVNSDAFDAFADIHSTGYVSTADLDVMTALGWRATSASWDGAFVNAETQAWLGRAPSSGEIQNYASELANGTTPDGVRQQLLSSSEGEAHTAVQVTGLYDTYMGRDPSAGELTTWEGLVLSGDDFTAVRSAILSDPAGRTHTDATITSLYETWFGRSPTAAEVSVWEGLIGGGQDFNALRMALVNDPASHSQIDANIASEYQAWFGRAPNAAETSVWEGLIRGGDDLSALRGALISDPTGQAYIAQTVTAQYETYLVRAPSPGELATWQGLFASGDSFNDLTTALQQTVQQAVTSVPGLYQSYMGRGATPGEISYWDNQITTAGATGDSIRRAIISDPAGQAYLAAQVTATYDYAFGRDPTAQELSVWQGLVLGGDDYTTLFHALTYSSEGSSYLNSEVNAVYETYLGRLPYWSDNPDWLYLMQSNGTPLSTVREALVTSAEGEAHTATEVTLLYDTDFGRDPSAAELSVWNGLIIGGDDFNTVRTALLTDGGGGVLHPDSGITSAYEAYFGRAPTSGELGAWEGLLGGGANFDTLRDTLERDPGASASQVFHVTAGAHQNIEFDPTRPDVVIQGFDPATDTIGVVANDFRNVNFLDLAHARQITALDGSTDVLISMDTTHSILIEHVQLSQLNSNIFYWH